MAHGLDPALDILPATKPPCCGAAFLNALGAADPAAYRDQLAEPIKLDYTQIPAPILAGEIPTFTAWKTLLTYIRKSDVNDIRTGKLDKYLDALESPPNIGSEPYQTLYRFYEELGLTGRMEAFRDKVLGQHPSYGIYMRSQGAGALIELR